MCLLGIIIALVDSCFAFLRLDNLFWGLRYCYLLLFVIDKCGFSVGSRGCDAERARRSLMPQRWVCAWEVTRVQRASDWTGFVNVTTLACQKEPSSQSRSPPFTFLIPSPLPDPLSPFSPITNPGLHHLSSPTKKNARMNGNIPRITPLGDPSGK